MTSATDPLAEALAPVVCDTFFEAAELPMRWPTAPFDRRRTFLAATTHALAAARAGRRSEEETAQALCEGFWAGDPDARPWRAHGDLQRQVFRRCARAMIAAAREMRDKRQVQQEKAA